MTSTARALSSLRNAATQAAREGTPIRHGDFPSSALSTGFDVKDIQAELSRRKKLRFLGYLAETGSRRSSASRAGYAVSTIDDLQKNDPDFRKAMDEAYRRAVVSLKDVAMETAMNGRVVDVWYKGEIVGQEIERDNNFLKFMLQSLSPDEFGEKSEQTTNLNVNVGVAILPPIMRDEASWERQAIDVHEQQKLLPASVVGTTLDAKPKTSVAP